MSGISSGVTLSMIAVIRFPSTQAAPISIKTQGRSIEYRLRRTRNSLHSRMLFRIDSGIDSPPAMSFRECLEHRLDAVYLQKVSAGFSGQLRRQRWPAAAKRTQIGLLGAEISHPVADCRPKSGRDFFDVIWAAKHSLYQSFGEGSLDCKTDGCSG